MDDSPEDFDGRRAEIDYPTRWEYRLIGADEARLRAVVAAVVGQAEYRVAGARPSRSGKWISLAVEVLVIDEAQRDALFEELSAHEDVRYLL